MSNFVYLFKNGDLYNIGCTNNIDRKKQNLKPGNLIATMKSDESDVICKQLQSIYQEERLPSSEYFRLSKSQASECKRQLEEIGGSNYYQPFFVGGRLFLAFILSWLLITFIIIQIGIEPILARFN